jgi:myo-inositol-1(or 4)-monophosphatase
VVGGVITLPALDIVAVAEENKGTVLNGKIVNVSAVNSVDKAFLVAGSEYSIPPTNAQDRRLYRRLLTSVNRTRNFGNSLYTLLLVANGTADIGVLLSKINLYDIAAGVIMVQEAGGQIFNARGGPWQPEDKTLVATNGKISLEGIF